MAFRAVILVIHILSAVIWLGFLPADMVLRGFIRKNRGKSGERRLISSYMVLTNLSGIIGMSGLLVTGILLVSTVPYYSFFDFASNHWLATKQVIMVILMVLVFALLIPKAKKVRLALSTNLDDPSPLGELAYGNLFSLERTITVISVLVLINFLLAVTHRFFG